MNKELERQNGILLSDRLDRYYASQSQMIQAITTPNIPPDLKMYYCESLLATRATMQALLRSFNSDNTETQLPSVEQIVEAAMKMAQAQPGAGAGNGNQQSRGSSPVSQVPSGVVGAGGVPAGTGLPK
jgi:hypothetical protein